MKICVCALSQPIDFWEGWMTEKEFKESVMKMYPFVSDSMDAWADYVKFRDKAFELAPAVNWEGDIREGPYIVGFPYGSGGQRYAIAWKQDNNGETFIASPEIMPWIKIPDNTEWIVEEY